MFDEHTITELKHWAGKKKTVQGMVEEFEDLGYTVTTDEERLLCHQRVAVLREFLSKIDDEIESILTRALGDWIKDNFKKDMTKTIGHVFVNIE